MLLNIIEGQHIDLPTAILEVLAMLFIIFCILPLHEYAHAWAAAKLGDNTAKNSGRLTMNPIASFDMIGALLLLLIGFGWAKPVPVNPRNFRNPKRGMALTALAGPLSNFLAALVGDIIFFGILIAMHYTMPFPLQMFFYAYIEVNVSLAVFNLIPLPPLDGSKILGAFLSDKALYSYYKYQNMIIIFVLVILFTGILNPPINGLINLCLNGLDWIARLPYHLFGLL